MDLEDSYRPFFEKSSKSILSVPQCVAVSHRRNGLAMFLNKRAALQKEGKNLFFCVSLPVLPRFLPNLLKTCVLLR